MSHKDSHNQQESNELANPNPGKCPITGQEIKPNITTTYKDKLYGFCCKECIPKFQENPDKYLGIKEDHSQH
ncbi:MAG: YHS domain-containing protein [Planctomycetes bacterium]|nr:YHS domain-containing protein [Planctomycetota bacterium]